MDSWALLDWLNAAAAGASLLVGMLFWVRAEHVRKATDEHRLVRVAGGDLTGRRSLVTDPQRVALFWTGIGLFFVLLGAVR